MIILGAILAMSTVLPICIGVGLANRQLREQLARQNRAGRATTGLSGVPSTNYPVLVDTQRSARVTQVTRHGQQCRVVEPYRIEVSK